MQTKENPHLGGLKSYSNHHSTTPPTEPPHLIGAELSTLGGLMLDNRAWPDVSGMVQQNDFYEEKNRVLFRAVQDLAAAGKPFDPVTLMDELERAGKLADAGGATWIGQAGRDTPSAANVIHYAAIVRRKSLERQRVTAIAGGNHDLASELTAAIKALEAGPQASAPLFSPDAVSEAVRDFLTTSPPPRKMLFEGLLPLGKAAGLVSPGGAGKSQLLLQMGISVASSIPFFGYEVSRPGSAVLIFAEEDTDELHRRLHNTIKFYEDNGILIDRDLLASRLLLVSVAGQEITFTHLDRDGNLCWSPDLNRLLLSLRQCQDLRLIGVDPVINFYAGDENSNTDMMRFMSAMVHIATETGATILLSHHTNKAATMTGQGAQAGAARGGSAFTNALRWQANLTALDKKDLAKFGIDQSKAGFYLGFTVAKSNYTRPIAPMFLFRDRNGVLAPTKLQAQGPGESKLESDAFLIRDAITKAGNEGIEYSVRKARDLLPAKLNISQSRVRAAIDYGLENKMFFKAPPTTRQPHQVGKVLSVTESRDSELQSDKGTNPQEIDAGILPDSSGLRDANPQETIPQVQEGNDLKLWVGSGLNPVNPQESTPQEDSSGLTVSSGLAGYSGLKTELTHISHCPDSNLFSESSGLRPETDLTHISPCFNVSSCGLSVDGVNPQKLLINQSGLRVNVGPLRGSSGLTHYPAGNVAGANGAPCDVSTADDSDLADFDEALGPASTTANSAGPPDLGDGYIDSLVESFYGATASPPTTPSGKPTDAFGTGTSSSQPSTWSGPCHKCAHVSEVATGGRWCANLEQLLPRGATSRTMDCQAYRPRGNAAITRIEAVPAAPAGQEDRP
jgi:hypothetical protein